MRHRRGILLVGLGQNMSKYQPKSGSNPGRVRGATGIVQASKTAARSTAPGKAAFTVSGQEVTLTANLSTTDRAPASFEVDAARTVMGTSPEAVFVQLDPLDRQTVTHTLLVRFDPITFFARPDDPSWRGFYDMLRAISPGRSLEEVDLQFSKLQRTSSTKSHAVRAWFDRLSRFGHTGFAMFATLDGQDVAQMLTPEGVGNIDVRPVVEVTMDLPVLVEFMKSWTKIALEHRS